MGDRETAKKTRKQPRVHLLLRSPDQLRCRLLLRKRTRLCENSGQHRRGRIFFHAGHESWPKLESTCSYSASFGRLFYLPLKSASFHTVSNVYATKLRSIQQQGLALCIILLPMNSH